MPGWKTIRDRDGNSYFIDEYGRMHASGKPEFRYKTLSADGIDYYLNQGIELIKGHYTLEGLLILKTILAMPPGDGKMNRVRAAAAKRINELSMREGDRFAGLNESASLLIYREGNEVKIIHDLMRYSLTVSGAVEVIRTSRKARTGSDYAYSGLLLGVKFMKAESRPTGGEGYDLLIAVSSEKFRSPLRSLEDLEEGWRSTLWESNYTREMIIKNDTRAIYRYRSSGEPRYSGYEGIYRNIMYGYMVRVITPEKNFPEFDGRIKAIVDTFSFAGIKN